MERDTEQGALPSRLGVDASGVGMRADVFLFRELPVVSRTRLRQKVQKGEALLNGHRFSTSTRLRAGDEILLQWKAAVPTDPGLILSILYEDECLLAVDKPAGVAAHPMGARQSGTLVQAARERYRQVIRAHLQHGDPSFYPTLVNRLDVPTSGIVLIALTRGVHRALQAMSAARRIDKEYAALVDGIVEQAEGAIDLPIGPCRDSAVELKMCCRPDGSPSLTRYQVVQRYEAHTLLRVFPVTGRQHQIRVHMAAIGHPVAGDLLYRDETLFLAALRADTPTAAPRLCLHARRAAFVHPVTGARLVIDAAVPPDMREAIRQAVSGEMPAF